MLRSPKQLSFDSYMSPWLCTLAVDRNRRRTALFDATFALSSACDRVGWRSTTRRTCCSFPAVSTASEGEEGAAAPVYMSEGAADPV